MDTRTAPYAALLLRLALGIMFLAHGLTKLFVFTLPGTAQFFESVGFPGVLAYPVTFFEILAGAMLILGILPRWVAAVAAVQLLAASSVTLETAGHLPQLMAAGNILFFWRSRPLRWHSWGPVPWL